MCRGIQLHLGSGELLASAGASASAADVESLLSSRTALTASTSPLNFPHWYPCSRSKISWLRALARAMQE